MKANIKAPADGPLKNLIKRRMADLGVNANQLSLAQGTVHPDRMRAWLYTRGARASEQTIQAAIEVLGLTLCDAEIAALRPAHVDHSVLAESIRARAAAR